MKPSLNILKGELERLFSVDALTAICRKYLGIDPEALGLINDNKAVYARQLVEWAAAHNAELALTDAVIIEKPGMTDPRLKHVFGQAKTAAVNREELAGLTVGDKISGNDAFNLYGCTAEDGREMVLMVVHGAHAVDQSAVQRFLLTCRVVQALDVSVVPRIDTVGCFSDGRPYVVWESVQGRPLRDAAPLSVDETLDLCEKIVDALGQLDESGLHAGVLTPDSVYWDADAQTVQLVGVGFDKLLSTGSWVHAPALAKFLAPEVMRGEEAGSAGDLYALGCVLFFAMTGKTAVAGRSALEAAAAHVSGERRALADLASEPVPAAVSGLCDRLFGGSGAQRVTDIGAARTLVDETREAVAAELAKAAQSGSREDIEDEIAALAADPASESALQALLDAADVYNAFGAASVALEEIAGSAGDAQVAQRLLSTAAQIKKDKTRNFERAAYLFDQLLQADPANQELFAQRIDVARKARQFETVVELLGQQAEATEDPQVKLEILAEIGRIFEKKLGAPEKAFDYYMACLTGGEGDKELVAALDKISSQHGRLEELVQAAANAAMAAETAGDAAMTAFYYRQLGKWYTQLQQPGVALTCFQKVLAVEPDDETAFEAVCATYRSAQQWLELAQVIAQRAESTANPDEKRRLLVETATVYFERMEQVDAAKELASNVLRDDPACTPALQLLRRIYEKTADYAGLVEVMRTTISAMGDGPEKVQELCALGEILEQHLQQPKEAMAAYKEAVELDSQCLDALKGLERTCAMVEDHVGLRDSLERQLALDVLTAKQRIALLERLSALYEEEFRDYEKAADALRKVVALDEENEAALASLCRHLTKLEAWGELVDVLHRRAQLVEGVDQKRALLTERLDVIKKHIGDTELAAQAVNELAALGGGETELYGVLRHQLELGQIDAAEETYRKMIDEAPDEASKVGLLVELAGFLVDKKNDLAAAEETLLQARSMAPENPDVLTELADVLTRKGDYAGALELYEKKIELVSGSEARAKVFAQMGILALDHIGDEEKALEYLERAVAVDNSNAAASDRLAGLYRKHGRWEDAIKIYERWIPSAKTLSQESQLDLFTHAAEAFEQVGRKERALELLQKAAALAEDPALMKHLADVALETEQWQMAKEQLERYAKAVFNELDNDGKVEVLVKRGRAAFGCEALDEAAKLARQATVLAPEDMEARLLLADVNEARKDYRGAVEARMRVLDQMDPQDPRKFDIVRSCASIMFDKLRNAAGAAELLNKALELDPDNRDLLGELLKMHYAAKRYADVVDVILRIAKLVDDDAQLARYYLTVAKIYRRELKQLDKAVSYFKLALKHDPDLEDARNALEAVLTETKDWEGLEGVYKERIARLPKDASLEDRMALLRPLADLYMTKLEGKDDEAIVLFETMAKMEPDNPEHLEKLVELYGWNTATADKAIAAHHKLLRKNMARVESYRMLYRIFSAQNDPDKAWCAASMLSVLNQATPDERQYYKDYLVEGYPPISDFLTDDDWNKYLYHPDMNRDITKIFSAIVPAIVKAKCQPLEQTGLVQMTPVDFTVDTAEFSQLCNFGFGVAGTPAIPLYYQNDQSGFGIVDTDPAVMIAGADAASMRDYLGLAFLLGQQLTLLRPGLFAKRLLTTGTELSSWLLAAIKMHVPQLPVPNNLISSVNEALVLVQKGVRDEDRDLLKGYVDAFVASAADVDLKRWARAVDYTGDRMGLILCGDVAVAMRMLEAELTDTKERADRIRELSLFMVSDALFALRKKLGVALQAG